MAQKTVHEKRRRLVVIIVTVIAAGVVTALVAAAIIMLNREDPAPDNNSLQDGSTVTVEGEYECLPKPGDGPKTLECAAGIHTDEDVYYGLELPGLRAKSGSDGNALSDYYKVGKRLRVTGVYHAAEQSVYQSSGTITVETVEPLK